MTYSDVPPATAPMVETAANYLKSGGVVAYPTDTVYGLGAVAGDDLAVRRLYQIKGRELDKPLPLLIASTSELDAIVAGLSEEAGKLIEEFWPGGLTLILARRQSFRSLALSGDTVAVRVPDHDVTRRLIELAGQPLTGTSANRSGAGSCRTAQEVRAQLSDDVDFILDDGPSPGGIESTVVDCTTGVIAVVRHGTVSVAEIERVVGHPLSS
jgi:L-threonylcarbamoyladenylate synthase